jgi:hypothetical protein
MSPHAPTKSTALSCARPMPAVDGDIVLDLRAA